MQAKLEPSEFSFILHTLSAEKAIGVNNAQLFPSNDTVQESLLAEGFDKLKEHGWLVAEGNRIDTNNQLALMAAVIIAPEQVVTLTRHVENDNKEYVFYYLAQDLIVEQFYTADQRYILTKLDSVAEVIGRLAQAFQLPTTITDLLSSVTLDTERFAQTMKLARAGNLQSLQSALIEADINPSIAKQLAHKFSGLQPLGDIEVSQLAPDQLIVQNDMVILQGIDGNTWCMVENEATASVTIQSLNTNTFAKLLQLMMKTNG